MTPRPLAQPCAWGPTSARRPPNAPSLSSAAAARPAPKGAGTSHSLQEVKRNSDKATGAAAAAAAGKARRAAPGGASCLHFREAGRTGLTRAPPSAHRHPSLTWGGGGRGQPAPTLAAELGRFLLGDVAAGRARHDPLGPSPAALGAPAAERGPLFSAASHVTARRLQFHFLGSEIANSSEGPSFLET